MLDHAKQAQDVKEVDDDEGPLVSQEVRHLLLQGCSLVGGVKVGAGGQRDGLEPDDDSPSQLRQCCPGLFLSHKVVFFILRSCHSN